MSSPLFKETHLDKAEFDPLMNPGALFASRQAEEAIVVRKPATSHKVPDDEQEVTYDIDEFLEQPKKNMFDRKPKNPLFDDEDEEEEPVDTKPILNVKATEVKAVVKPKEEEKPLPRKPVDMFTDEEKASSTQKPSILDSLSDLSIRDVFIPKEALEGFNDIEHSKPVDPELLDLPSDDSLDKFTTPITTTTTTTNTSTTKHELTKEADVDLDDDLFSFGGTTTTTTDAGIGGFDFNKYISDNSKESGGLFS